MSLDVDIKPRLSDSAETGRYSSGASATITRRLVIRSTLEDLNPGDQNLNDFIEFARHVVSQQNSFLAARYRGILYLALVSAFESVGMIKLDWAPTLTLEVQGRLWGKPGFVSRHRYLDDPVRSDYWHALSRHSPIRLKNSRSSRRGHSDRSYRNRMTHVRNLLRKLAIELYPTSRSDERTGESWDISMASGYLDAEDATSSLAIMRQLRSGLGLPLHLSFYHP